MRKSALVVVVLCAAATLLGATPAVEARGFCAAAVDAWCPGTACIQQTWGWQCTDNIIVCVREPCP